MSVSASNADIINIGTLTCSGINVSDATLSSAASGRGSLRVIGADDGGYNGVEIPTPSSGMNCVLMNNGTNAGLYSDTDTDWLFYSVQNSFTYLRYDDSNRLQTISAGIDITGNLTHDGLTMTSGTDLDQLYTPSTVVIALVTGTDVSTGIRGNAFTTGSYAMQCYVNNDGHNIGMYYAGIVTFSNVIASTADVITIPTSASGYDTGSPNNFITFKMYLKDGDTNYNTLYMNAPYTTSGPAERSYQFSFRRLI